MSCIKATAGGLCAGFLVCSELWFTEHARAYGRAGASVIITPRATELGTAWKWECASVAASFVSGAFNASSNRLSSDGVFGGTCSVFSPSFPFPDSFFHFEVVEINS